MIQISKNLELRPLQDEDANALSVLTDQNRTHLRPWLPWLDSVRTVTDTQNFIQATKEQFAKNNDFQLGIWHNNDLVGVIGLHHIDWSNRKTSIVYWLSQHAEGQGLMTKSCQALVNYVFENLKLNRIEIACATGNQKSRAIPERLNFINEGIVKQVEWLYDHFVDHVRYRLLTQEWTINSS